MGWRLFVLSAGLNIDRFILRLNRRFFFSTNDNIAVIALELRGKWRWYTPLVRIFCWNNNVSHYKLARAMHVRFFGSFVGLFVYRICLFPRYMAAFAIKTTFYIIALLLRARVFPALMRYSCAIFAFRFLLAVFGYMFEFVAFKALTDPDYGIV
jgi:hypothetical protein